MRTDNGTNYVGANNLLKREVQMALTTIQSSRDFKSKMDEWEVEWEFETLTLRPIDLMVGAMEPRRDCAPPCLSVPQDELRRGHRFTKRIAELWERWCKIYLSGLQERKKWRHETRDFTGI